MFGLRPPVMFGLTPPVMFASLSMLCPRGRPGLDWPVSTLRLRPLVTRLAPATLTSSQRTVPEVTSDPGANILKTILKKNEQKTAEKEK